VMDFATQPNQIPIWLDLPRGHWVPRLESRLVAGRDRLCLRKSVA
jgi:hypothetical protein